MDHDPPEDPSPDPFSEPGAHAPPAELDYELVRLIGRGGYGEVWLVRDRARDYFACKVVYRESFGNARPYEREYEGIQKFEPVSQSSESQVKILHVGRRDEAGYFYYIMELADDVQSAAMDAATYVPKTLRSEIEERKKLPVSECIGVGLSLTAALDNLHRHGLIHRDIKPANIIFVQGVPKLADIGLVTDLDVTVSYVGTEGFIPPEGPKSAQADILRVGKSALRNCHRKRPVGIPGIAGKFQRIYRLGKPAGTQRNHHQSLRNRSAQALRHGQRIPRRPRVVKHRQIRPPCARHAANEKVARALLPHRSSRGNHRGAGFSCFTIVAKTNPGRFRSRCHHQNSLARRSRHRRE